MSRRRRFMSRFLGFTFTPDTMLWIIGATAEWTSGNVIDWE